MENVSLQSAEFFGQMLLHSVARVSYFETSSSRVLTPVEALEEAKDAIEAYSSEPEQTWRAIPYALKRVIYSVEVSTLREQLFLIREIRQLVDDIDEFHAAYARSRNRRAYVDSAVSNLSQHLNLAFRAGETIYSELLIDRAIGALSNQRSEASNRDKIVTLVPELCTYLNYQGRDVEALANSVMELIAEARSGSPRDLGRQLAALLASNPRNFVVATVITGAINAPVPQELKGETVRFPGPVYWKFKLPGVRGRNRKQNKRQRTSEFANSDLMDFCLEHWKTDAETPNRQHRVAAQIVLWQVEAWDPIHARQLALDRAESFMDRINAEHRVGEFGVKRKVLVWENGSTETTYLTDVFEGPRNTRVMGGHRSPSVQRSLRLASRAANERAGAMAIFFGWAALEYLGRGNQVRDSNNNPLTPQNFIAKFVPKVAGLVALHHLANDVAHAIVDVKPVRDWGKPLQRYLKLSTKDVPNDYVDQRNLFHFLAASSGRGNAQTLADKLVSTSEEVESALSEFEALLAQTSPASHYKIRQVRHLLRSPERMADYLSDVERDADVALQRMRYVRNQTAHSTIPESIRYKTLSNAMREILDTCYQAIDKANDEAPPYETIHQLAIQFDNLINDLRNGRGEKMFSPHRVLYVSNETLSHD